MMDEPFFPRTGKPVVPLTSVTGDDEATLVSARPNLAINNRVSRRRRRIWRLVIWTTLLFIPALLTNLFEPTFVSEPEPTHDSTGEYEILPASLVRANPFPEYTLTLEKGEWVDTRIVIRRDQEVRIEYTEDSRLSPWAVKTAAGDERDCPYTCRIVSNRWDAEGHNEPIETDYLLGDLHQDTLKMALYWVNDRPITLNIIVRALPQKG